MREAVKVGDRVKLRGRLPTGVLRHVDPVSKWARVEWDSEAVGPQIVHFKELEHAT